MTAVCLREIAKLCPGSIRRWIWKALSVCIVLPLTRLDALTHRSITYLTTSSFSLYLVPFLIKRYIRRHQGKSRQSDESG
jgi:hypothetical protein